MMDNEMSLTIPKDVVESAVRDKISAAIARELGDPAELIRKQVEAALNQKVASNGKVSSSSYENKYNFLETMATEFIQNAAKKALAEYFQANEEKIKNAVKKEVAKSPLKIAKVFTQSLIESLNCKYSNSISISFNSKRD